MKKFFLLFTCFIAGVVQNYAQDNLIKNGTFDGNPSYTSWNIQTVDAPIANQQKDGNPGGYVWLNHNGGGSDPSVSQEVKGLKVGAKYIVWGDYKVGKHANIHSAVPGRDFFAVDIDGAEKQKYQLPAQKDNAKKCDDVTWMTFSVVFTATKTAHTVRLRGEINGADADVAIDNVKMMEELPAKFKVLAYSIHQGQGVQEPYWFGMNKGEYAGKILNKSQLAGGTLMEIQKVDFPDGSHAFKVTNAGDDMYLTAQDNKAVVVEKAPNGVVPEGAKFKTVGPLTAEKGANERNFRSFVSIKYKDHYLRHTSFILFIFPNNGQELFKQDASWLIEKI